VQAFVVDIIRIIRPFAQNNRKCRQIINPFSKNRITVFSSMSKRHTFPLFLQTSYGYDASAYRFAQLENCIYEWYAALLAFG
jgi:hypothetical protein